MSFPDPIAGTLNGVAFSLNEIRDDGLLSEYISQDQMIKLIIQHTRTNKGRIRSQMNLTVYRSILNAQGATILESSSHQYSWDRPSYGWTAAFGDQEKSALNGLLTTANVAKLFGLEH